jgi:hypothetical protein
VGSSVSPSTGPASSPATFLGGLPSCAEGENKRIRWMTDERGLLDQGPMTTTKKKEKGIRPPPSPHTPATPFLAHHLLVGDVGGVGGTLLGGLGCGGLFLLRRGLGRLRELGLRRWGVLRCRCVDGLLGKEVRRGWVVDSEQRSVAWNEILPGPMTMATAIVGSTNVSLLTSATSASAA